MKKERNSSIEIHDGISKSTFTITDLLVSFTFTELRTKDR